MNFQKFEKLISSARYNRYLIAAANNPEKAQKLYLASLKVAQALHPLLGLTEIVLRNKIDQTLASYFNDPDWIINQISGFMSDPSLVKTDPQTGRQIPDQWIKKEVNKARNRLNSSHTPVTVGKIISEQTFGFWTELFDTKYYRILAGRPIQIFSGLPATYGRREIAQDLNAIRRFRNRINHNEPICFGPTDNLDFTKTMEVYEALKNILRWLDADLTDIYVKIDQVERSIRKANWVISKWNFLNL